MQAFQSKILFYWLAANGSAWQAGVHACKAYMGIATAHAAVESIPALDWQQLLAAFVAAFVIEFVNYMDLHPISDLIPKPKTNE